MNAQQIMSIVKNHKGQVLPFAMRTTIEPLKAHKDKFIVKHTNGYVIGGSEFRNRKAVREAIEAGERGEVQPLPWGTWQDYPFIITHKGNEYIRLYLPTEEQCRFFNIGMHVEFTCNGQPIDRETAILFCGSKAKASDEKPECISPNACNIVAIG